LWKLTTKTVVEHGTPVLFLEGRLDHARAAELREVAGQLLTGAPDLIVDMSGVDYLSSAALKVFESLAVEQSQRKGRLTLRAPSVAARLALELSGLLALVDSPRPD
jgi:anti-anti-sigma factor